MRNISLIGILIAVSGLFGMNCDPRQPAPPPESAQSPHEPGILVVDMQDGASERDLESLESILAADLSWTHEDSKDEALVSGWVDDLDHAVAKLAGNPLVEIAEPSMGVHMYGGVLAEPFPNDPMYDKQWHMKAMGAPYGWDNTSRGKGVVVAVVDTGVSTRGEDRPLNILRGKSFVDGEFNSDDLNGHGTHCAGTIAEATNNGIGMTGVAPDATILPVKVLSQHGSGSSEGVAAGVDWAADNGAHVISMSLGGSYSGVIHNAIKKARAKGVIVVAAAGNSGRRGVGYPGALEETIGVSATGPDGKPAPYTSFGKGVDVAAPGGNKEIPGGGVWQETIGKTGHSYLEFQGTSMATPHVAGAVAVLLGQGMTPDQAEKAILETARGQGWDEYLGNGHLDLQAALSGSDRSTWLQFGLGGLFALLISTMTQTSTRFRILSTIAGALLGGGLWFLPGTSTILVLLGSSPLDWPSLISPSLVGFPLWVSCAGPALVAFIPLRSIRPWALGVCAGTAAFLFVGAAQGTVDPWWMPGWAGVAWLVGHGIISLGLGMSLAGVEKLEAK